MALWRTSRQQKRRKTRRKKSGVWSKIKAIPYRLKRFSVRVFIVLTVLSASFPSVTEGAATWFEGFFPQVVSAEKAQMILAIPLVGDILKRANLPWGAIPELRTQGDEVTNPFT